ncbi:WD40/YVTN/BNR-like repeat-containing protein [Phytoactinopolyspora mesophila]|uniref:Glycosyl hydrolase n=1 Tax=Phytoactinopolyspora mesophila TaxID=2650750 RepID=A0A7K3M2P7_9ACTN|nr:glycosyl hydrolase [Phytoactinopolyspora mesophila]NDL57564.1 glycosyl hydrolase [Phytoactinopolyspora mesophila]
MKSTLARHQRGVTAVAVLALVAAVALVASLVSARGEDTHATSMPTGPMELPGEWMTSQRLSDGVTEVSAATYASARSEAQSIERRTRNAYRHLAQLNWDFFGPANIGGRVVDIAIDPEVDDQIFIAAASGGIWKSSDAGMTYQSVWPDDWVQGMGAVAITSDGVLFAGTGEPQPGGGSITFGGDGIYRSYDRGETWENVGLEDSHAIARFAIDPSDEDRIFAAAAGNLFVPGGERGVYLTEDGGDTWREVLTPLNDTTGATEVVIDPDNPDRVYAAMWDHLREPHQRTYGGPGSSLWRSDDGGATWERMTNGLPTDDDQGRWGLTLAPSNPDRLYAYVGTALGPFRAFYRSDDGGDSWTQTPLTAAGASQSTFSWWFGKIWVDPTDEDHVFLAGVQLRRSTDGAMSFTNSGGIHVDQHKMAWDPDVPDRVYLGNDGGMYRSDANGATNTWTKATDEPYTQFYSVDAAETDPVLKVGGTQDNGCLRGYNGPGGRWDAIGCGDGLQVIIHPEDPTIVFGCSQYGSCYRSENSGDTPRQPIGAGQTTSQRRNWFTPLVFDPSDPDVMYYAGNIVNRSTDNGRTWTAISPDLTGGGPNDPAGYPWGTITAVAVAPTDGDTLYAGTDDGKLWWTDDVGENWHEVDSSELPGTWVTRIAVHPDDAKIAYATFSGFRSGSDRPHLLVTQDGGKTWSDIGQGLPDAPVNSVVPTSDGLLIVGTDVGVYLSAWNGGEWASLGSDLPVAATMYMRYHEPSRQLSVATFGRGIYEIDVPQCRAASTRLPLRDPGVGVPGVLASCRAAQ